MRVLAACANSPTLVAQISNLLSRRASSLPVAEMSHRSCVLSRACRLEIGDTADWKSALLRLRLRRARSIRGSPLISHGLLARNFGSRRGTAGRGQFHGLPALPCRIQRDLAFLRFVLGTSCQVFGRSQDGLDEAADREMVLADRVPKALIEHAFVFAPAQLAAEVEMEVRVDHGADEPLLVHGLRREGLHALAGERIRRDELLIRVVDGLAVVIFLAVAALVVPAVALKGERREQLVATVAE